MRLTDEPGALLIRRSPPAYWALGAILAGLGAFCVLAAAIDLSDDERIPPPRFRVGLALVGCVAAAAGACILWRAPLSTLAVDGGRKTLTITRRGLFGKVTEQFPTAAIADVRVKKERSDRGASVYRVELVLVSGSVVPVSLIHPKDRDGCMRAAERLWVALGLPRA